MRVRRATQLLILTPNVEKPARDRLANWVRDCTPRQVISLFTLLPSGYFSWMGEESVQETKCLAEKNNHLYISAETKQELVEAFKRTLACL